MDFIHRILKKFSTLNVNCSIWNSYSLCVFFKRQRSGAMIRERVFKKKKVLKLKGDSAWLVIWIMGCNDSPSSAANDKKLQMASLSLSFSLTLFDLLSFFFFFFFILYCILVYVLYNVSVFLSLLFYSKRNHPLPLQRGSI